MKEKKRFRHFNNCLKNVEKGQIVFLLQPIIMKHVSWIIQEKGELELLDDLTVLEALIDQPQPAGCFMLLSVCCQCFKYISMSSLFPQLLKYVWITKRCASFN